MSHNGTALRPLRTALIAGLISVLAVMTLGSAPAQPAEAGEKPGAPSNVPLPDLTPGSDVPAPAPDDKQEAAAAPECLPPDEDGFAACLEVSAPDEKAQFPPRDVTGQAVVPVPDWCIENAFRGVFATRTQACEVSRLTYTTTRTVNGVTTTTGVAQFNVINYSFSDTGLPTWVHQIELSAYAGWGDALNASVRGTATGSGPCVRNSSTFPSRPISPLGRWNEGDSDFTTTATAPGASGTCPTTWAVTFTNGVYSPAGINYSMDDIRCDNAVSTRTAGCVVPWYPSAVYYSSSSYPELASHVSRAQASGLPGATFANPLTRATNATRDANRRLACGDAPSISGLSCDEYPVASSNQGLTAGGTRRTFSGCSLPGIPQGGTGPTGVSVCMIPAGQNNAQGGLHSQFERRERVLTGDPFRVIVTS